MKKSKTREELLLNTIERFDAKTRAYDEASGGCAYHLGDGRRCAIGAEVTVSAAKKLQKDYNGMGITSDVFFALPKRLKNMGQNYLEAIQNLHDDSRFWDDEGLTIRGKREVNRIIDEFDLELKHFDQKDWRHDNEKHT